jgi:hypothetical protein
LIGMPSPDRDAVTTIVSPLSSDEPESASAGALASVSNETNTVVFFTGFPPSARATLWRGVPTQRRWRSASIRNDGQHATTGRRQGTRNRVPMRPRPHSFVAQTESYRAETIPWIKARATGALAGLLACGSSLDIRPSRAFQDVTSSPVAAFRQRRKAMDISLTAHSCRDSRGFGWLLAFAANHPHRVPILSLLRGTSAILNLMAIHQIRFAP